MTNFVSAYNFMDLLKDKGFAPQTDVNSNKVVSMVKELVSAMSLKIEQALTQYNYMDLLQDNGYVPVPANDNQEISLGVVAALNELVGKLAWNIELPVEHHDFMDLLHDKGFVPAYSNDNALNIQVA